VIANAGLLLRKLKWLPNTTRQLDAVMAADIFQDDSPKDLEELVGKRDKQLKKENENGEDY
jgi:hypothetical protein